MAARPAVKVVRPEVPRPVMAASGASSVTLRFRNQSAMVAVGASGKRYRFHGAGSMQAVHHGDADALLASGLFERVWG